jgi:hypothetical protein
MNLPDAPIAQEGFFTTHFFTVSDQDKSNLRVADIWACCRQWSDKGAIFLAEPLDNHGWEWRCYMRDPDGYLIEVGQYTEIALDWVQ